MVFTDILPCFHHHQCFPLSDRSSSLLKSGGLVIFAHCEQSIIEGEPDCGLCCLKLSFLEMIKTADRHSDQLKRYCIDFIQELLCLIELDLAVQPAFQHHHKQLKRFEDGRLSGYLPVNKVHDLCFPISDLLE